MQRYGCIQARVDGIELTVDPSHATRVADGSLDKPAPPPEVIVTGDERPPSKLNPLLRHSSLGLGPLLVPARGEKQVAP